MKDSITSREFQGLARGKMKGKLSIEGPCGSSPQRRSGPASGNDKNKIPSKLKSQMSYASKIGFQY
jgi:hypothetical protein